MVDCKGGVEGAKWQRVADTVVGSIAEADILFTDINAEMHRRMDQVKLDMREGKYFDSRIHPGTTAPLIIVYIDELAVLGNPIKEDKDLEAIRKHAMFMLNELLYLGRALAICVITCIQRPDAALVGGSMRNNLQNRLVGRVDTPGSSDVALGTGMAASGVDASKLTDHWFIAQIEGKSICKFKTPGELDDSDLKQIALNPRYYCPEGRGSWLTAEPETAEAIAPWWPDSPYHEAFLNGFRDDGDDLEDDCGFEPAGGSYADSYGNRGVAPEEECAEFWDDDEDGQPVSRPARGSSRRRPANRPTSRPSSYPDEEYEMPWDEPNRPARRSTNRPAGPRRRPSSPDYEDLEEISMDDIMGMVADTEAEANAAPGPQVEYRKARPSRSKRPVVDDLQAGFEELDLDEDDQSFWGNEVMQDEDDDDDELVDWNNVDMDTVWWGAEDDLSDGREEPRNTRTYAEKPVKKVREKVMALPPHTPSSKSSQPVPSEPSPASSPAPASSRQRKRVQASSNQTNNQTASSSPAPSTDQPNEAENKENVPRPRRRSGKVKKPAESKPMMWNGRPVF